MAIQTLVRATRIAQLMAVLARTLWTAHSQAALDCGQRTLVAVGVISTPEYKKSIYKVTCQWTLTPEEGNELRLTFEDFDLGPETRLEIYNGTDSMSPGALLTTYYGNGPLEATVSGKPVLPFPGAVTLKYINAESYHPARGFLLYFYSESPPTTRENNEYPAYVCGESRTDGAGTVHSPGYPGWYPLNTNCTWTLKSCDASTPLVIAFTSLNLENSRDWVRLYAEPDRSLGQTTGTLIAELTGSTLPQILVTAPVVIVAFSSDNVNPQNNTGFALQFATELLQAANDSSLVGEACEGMCPKTAASTYSYCTVWGDPHISPFNARYYGLQEEGIFFLYKHAVSPIWVQAAFQRCTWGNSPTCVCAVAVRLCSELFVVDHCFTSANGQRPNRIYKAGSGSLMQISQHSAGWLVTLPSGLSVTITRLLFGGVSLQDRYNSAGATGGVCTTKRRCGSALETLSGLAYNSWRVQTSENLFTAWPAASPPISCNVAQCKKQCSKYQDYDLPAGVSRGEDLPASQFSNSAAFYLPTRPSVGRKRREVPAGLDFSPPWTQEMTLYHCRSLITQHAGLQLCQNALSGDLDLENSVTSCVLDILYTNTTAFDGSALEHGKGQCLQQLEEANVSKAEVLAHICPFDCTNHGSCENGSCVCSTGWLGADCSQSASQVPVLTSTSKALNCPDADVHRGVCLRQLVFGTPFFGASPGYPACSITTRAAPSYINGQLTDGSAAVMQNAVSEEILMVVATVSSQSVISCRLPAGAPGQTLTYEIRVTNDGVAYSNNVKDTRIFYASDQSRTEQTYASTVQFATSQAMEPGQEIFNNRNRSATSTTHIMGTNSLLTTRRIVSEGSAMRGDHVSVAASGCFAVIICYIMFRCEYADYK